MRFENVNDVKKWFRGIVPRKRDIELKLEFYRDLLKSFERSEEFDNAVKYYREQIDRLQNKMAITMEETERIMNLLEEDERLVMTARYIKMIKWDYIEYHVYYSRRQSVRVHDRAVEKLVGQTVKE